MSYSTNGGASWELPPPTMELPPPPSVWGLPPTTPGSGQGVASPTDRSLQRVNVASRVQRLSTPLPLRPGPYQLPGALGSLSSPSLPIPDSPSGRTTSPATGGVGGGDSSPTTNQSLSSSGNRRTTVAALHNSGDTALPSGNGRARFSSSVSQLGSGGGGAGNAGSPSSPSSPVATSPVTSPGVSKRKSMLVNPFSRSSSSNSFPSTPAPLSPKSSQSGDPQPVSPPLGSSFSYSPLNSPKNRKTVSISSPPSPSLLSPSYSSPSPVNSSSHSAVASPTESPRGGKKGNTVQLLAISGGGGGGVIKEMSASLLKTLLGGDNAKYPVVLDFSKGYLLTNDYFFASCPDIIKEVNLSHNQLKECNSLSQLSKLKRLVLDNNKISDITFENLLSLKVLSLMGNELEYLTSMSDLGKLEHLNLSGNKLTTGFHELAKLKSLQSLNLSDNSFNFTLRKFYSFILLPLKKHVKLQSLSIGRGNPVAANIPHFRLWVIHELPQLKILDERLIDKSEVEEAARLEASGQWADKDGDRLEKKANWSAPAEASGRVVASHLNIGAAPPPPVEEATEEKKKVIVVRTDLNVGGGDGDTPVSSSNSGEMPKVVVVRRPDLNVGSPTEDTAAATAKRNFRPDLNVSIGGAGEGGEEESGGGRKQKTKKEKKDKGKKEKSGSGIKGGKKGSKLNTAAAVRSRAGSAGDNDDKERWPTDPSLLARIASALPQQQQSSSSSYQGGQRLSQQLTASQNQFVSGGQTMLQQQQQRQQQAAEEVSVESRIDHLRSFFLLDDLSHTLCLFAQAAATPMWGPNEFLHLNNQLKQLVLHTKVMYERVQQFLARYPFEEKRITDATVMVQANIRGLVISVKQLNEAQARGGTVATTISSAKELALALFRMFNIVEEGAIPSTDETAADIQEAARGVMKLIQIATGMSRELPIDQYSELLLQQSERLNIKIPTLQNPEVQRRAAVSTASINGSITKLIALSQQYHNNPNPLLLQDIRQTAQTIATEFQSINAMVHTSRFASPLSPYDERVMYETSHQLLIEENNYVGIHEEAMLPNERQVLHHMKKMTDLAGEVRGVVGLKPVSIPHLTQLVLDMSSVGARTCQQLYITASNYVDRATREQLERYGRAIRYYSFVERTALCALILLFSAPDVLHLSTSMKGQAFCTANAIKIILLSALTQAPQVTGAKRLSGVNFDELLTMLK